MADQGWGRRDGSESLAEKHQIGICSYLKDGGKVASGGIAFFHADNSQYIGSYVCVGVHFWNYEDDNGNEIITADYPISHTEHFYI